MNGLNLPRYHIPGFPQAVHQRWFRCGYSNSSGLSPTYHPLPFRVLEVTGCAVGADGQITLQIDTPSSTNPDALCFSSFDGGVVTLDLPTPVLVPNADVAVGTFLGVTSGSEYLSYDRGGAFVSLGQPTILPDWGTSSTHKAVLVGPRRFLDTSISFKTQSGAGISGRSGATYGSGTVDVYDSSGVDTGVDVTVLNNSTNTVATSKFGIAVLGEGGVYYVVSAEGYTP